MEETCRRTQQEQRSKISSTATESYWTGSTRRKRAIADFPSPRQPRKFCPVTSLAAIFDEKNGEVNFNRRRRLELVLDLRARYAALEYEWLLENG